MDRRDAYHMRQILKEELKLATSTVRLDGVDQRCLVLMMDDEIISAISLRDIVVEVP